MKKKIYNNKLLLLFVLLFGASLSSLRPQTVHAGDAYARQQITNHYTHDTNYYYVNGYVHYESYSYDSNRATHYESGWGRWTDSKPKVSVNDLYNPAEIVGRRNIGRAPDFGFTGFDAFWVGNRRYWANVQTKIDTCVIRDTLETDTEEPKLPLSQKVSAILHLTFMLVERTGG